MVQVTGSTGAAIYVDPEHLRCAFCRSKMVSEVAKPQAQGFPHTIQVWCDKAECSARNMVGEVPIWNIPSTRHRQRA